MLCLVLQYFHIFPVVVDAYAAWCGPCKAIVSTLKRIKNELGDDLLHFATVSVIYVVMLSLSVSTLGKLKSLLDSGENRTCDLWFANPIASNALLSYEVKSVGMDDISELSLAPSISVCFYDLEFSCIFFSFLTHRHKLILYVESLVK